ncbi:MAG: DUF4097 family beta strand repeat protein [Opitutaceae bacterium]|nr:DUF4097 family beta strand repeat protein [Opitutaceae bacterium]
MKTSRPPLSLLLAACALALLATGFTVPRAQAGAPTVIAFSDPDKPGTVKLSVKMGDITITGSDRQDVSLETDYQPEDAPVRSDGLRVLTESATYKLVEKDNVIVLDTGNSWAGFNGESEFHLEVPRGTNVVIANGFGGEISIAHLDGDIEIKSMNGEINLDDIAGGVLVETMNSEISAKFAKLSANKPISLTSMNGEIDIHVPADAPAKVRLRTQNGAILTDFDAKTLVTQTEELLGPGRPNLHNSTGSDIREAVREAVRAGVEAAREAANAVREAAQAAREEARAQREANDAARTGSIPPIAPLPPVPAMTGGKIVSGALNGGNGPEIYVAAMNGDITLRKAND